MADLSMQDSASIAPDQWLGESPSSPVCLSCFTTGLLSYDAGAPICVIFSLQKADIGQAIWSFAHAATRHMYLLLLQDYSPTMFYRWGGYPAYDYKKMLY
jgi:hypothetical protein